VGVGMMRGGKRSNVKGGGGAWSRPAGDSAGGATQSAQGRHWGL
jgi:hypothetical protein